jgi:transcription elongation factor Elf1
MTEKIFIYNDNKAIIICPNCEKSKTIDVVEDTARLQHKCSCGYLHSVLLERRKRHRKITNLKGTYTCLVSGKQVAKGSMTIQDITRAGLSFKFDQSAGQKFNMGDNLLLEFHIDDESKSLIKKQGVIRHMRGPYIGVEFSSVDLYDRALGLYMFS